MPWEQESPPKKIEADCIRLQAEHLLQGILFRSVGVGPVHINYAFSGEFLPLGQGLGGRSKYKKFKMRLRGRDLPLREGLSPLEPGRNADVVIFHKPAEPFDPFAVLPKPEPGGLVYGFSEQLEYKRRMHPKLGHPFPAVSELLQVIPHVRTRIPLRGSTDKGGICTERATSGTLESARS